MENIFFFESYKSFLNAQIQRAKAVRGYKGKLAKAAGCQLSYLSKVVRANLHLTPEHAMGLAKYWNMTEEETHYLLDLLHKDRAGTVALRRYYESRLETARELHQNLKHRLALPELHSAEAESFYYSAWYHSAIHILVSIEEFQTIPALARVLRIHPTLIESSLLQLLQYGLVKREGALWFVGPSQLHAGKDSVFSKLHQMNWRVQAMASLQSQAKTDFHYSGLHSLSKADVRKFQEELAKLVERFTDIVRASPAETLVCVNLDSFNVIPS